MGAQSLADLFNRDYYTQLQGGILEGFGRLFKNNVKLYIYPYQISETQSLLKVDNLEVEPSQTHLYEYLKERDVIKQIENYNEAYLNIFSPQVLKMIGENKAGWEHLVPDEVAERIKQKNLFGYKA
jgi:hypothetical protein